MSGTYIREFTEQAEDKFWDKISLQTDKKLNEFENDKNKVVEYLKEEKNTITLGFAIKRYICEKFSTDFSEKDNKYKCVIKLDDARLMEFQVDSFDKEDCSNEEYIKLMQLLVKKNKVKHKNNDKYIERQNLKRWLEAKICEREMFLRKISFILEMQPEEVNLFLNKVLSERNYNFRRADEIIYYFCHKHNLKSDKAEELLEKYNNINDENTDNVSKNTEYMVSEVVKIDTEEELIDYLKKNRSNFLKISQTAKELFTKLILDIKDIVKFVYPENVKEDGTVSNNFLEKIFRDGIQFNNNDEITNSAKLKQSELKDILYQTLNRATIGKKLNGEMEIVRKDIIFLCFYRFSLLCSGYSTFKDSKFEEEAEAYCKIQSNNSTFNMMEFRDITDNMLQKCGMGKLYIPNRFDNLILLSLCDKEPIEYFSDVIQASFPKG